MAIGGAKIIAGTVLAVLSGGIVAGSIYILNYQSTLKDRLSSEGFNTKVENTEWTEIFNAYSVDGVSNTFTLNSEEEKSANWLKNKCNEALNKNDHINYKLARQWCVKTQAINEILKNGKFKVLNNHDDKNDWKIKLNILNNDVLAKEKISITWTKTEDEKIEEIKQKCKEIIDLKNTDKSFDEKFELAKNWCSIKAS